MERQISLARNLAQLLFVLWIGGVAPVTYFNVFALDHFVTPYKISLLEQLPTPRVPISVALTPAQLERIKHNLLSRQDVLTNQTLYLSMSQFFESSQNLFWLSWSGSLLLVFCRGRLSQQTHLRLCSVDLPPPDRPPRSLCLSVNYTLCTRV